MQKQRTLHQHGVPYYWIVDPEHETLTVLRDETAYLRILDAGLGDTVRAESFYLTARRRRVTGSESTRALAGGPARGASMDKQAQAENHGAVEKGSMNPAWNGTWRPRFVRTYRTALRT